MISSTAMTPVRGSDAGAGHARRRATSVAPNADGDGAAGPAGGAPPPGAPPGRDGQGAATPLRGTALKRFNRAARRAARDADRRVCFVLENVNYPVNVGSLVRIADGCGGELVLAGTTPDPTSPSAAKVARGHQAHVRWRREPDVAAAIRDLRAAGWWVVALELAAASRPYHAVAYPPRVALVVGNEDHGVTRRALAACDAAVYVPMLGRGASLNVHVAAAVVAYRACFPTPSSPSA